MKQTSLPDSFAPLAFPFPVETDVKRDKQPVVSQDCIAFYKLRMTGDCKKKKKREKRKEKKKKRSSYCTAPRKCFPKRKAGT